MYNSGIEIPQVDFSTITKSLIPLGSYFVGFDLGNLGKLSKMDNAGLITVIEGGSIPVVGSVTGLDTDNTDPQNPIVQIAVDGTTITGLGTLTSPLIANGMSYTLPTASSTVLGGIKIGTGLSIDGSGVVSTSGGGTTGSGTTNYVARWTPNGTTLGTGLIRDNGTSVSVGAFPAPDYKLFVTTITQPYAFLAENNFVGTQNQFGILGISLSVGSTGQNIGVNGEATGNTQINIGGTFSATGSTSGINTGLTGFAQGGASNYAIQLRDGSQGVGKFLKCVDTQGRANWSDLQYTNLQKIITTSNYVLTDADNDYTIFVNNGATAISISLGAITIPNFSGGFIQEGSADVTFVGVTNPIGLKSKGQGYQTYIERKLSTSSYYLLGNTKA